MMKNFLVLFCFISMAATCQKNTTKSQDSTREPCDPTIICTMEFKIIKLQITNESGEPVVLDDFYTQMEGEQLVIPKDLYELKNGKYPVATDAQMKDLDFEGNKLFFVGFHDGKEVVRHQMIIGKDCCHIQHIEGEQTIKIK